MIISDELIESHDGIRIAITGRSGSGRTHVTLNIAIEYLLKSKSVLYI